jgi:hypothetical protein
MAKCSPLWSTAFLPSDCSAWRYTMQQRMRSILLYVLLDFKGRAAVVLLARLFRHNSVLVLENLLLI